MAEINTPVPVTADDPARPAFSAGLPHKKPLFTHSLLFESTGALIMWIAVYITTGTKFPYDYDSVNYALAIIDKFDIRLHQPHLPYFFHILFCGIFHPFISNPFILQQIVNIIYISIAFTAFFLIRPARGYMLLAASTPLILFFTCVPVVHAAALMWGALIALTLSLHREGKISPVIPAAVFFTSIGFRPDLIMFMGPVVALALYNKLSFRQFIIIMAAGIIITLCWYVPASLLSGGVSPFMESAAMSKFAVTNSIFLGATPFQHIRSATRFLIYAFGVVGPGGLLFIIWTVTNLQKKSLPLLAAAVVPFMLYGILIYLPYPNYYAPVIGFVLVWLSICNRKQISSMLVLSAVAANCLFFWFMPAPEWYSATSFQNRSVMETVKKQVLYLGANCRNTTIMPKRIMAEADKVFSGCACFAVSDDKLVPERIWLYMSNHVWHNTFAGKNGDCCKFIFNAADGTFRFVTSGE